MCVCVCVCVFTIIKQLSSSNVMPTAQASLNIY